MDTLYFNVSIHGLTSGKNVQTQIIAKSAVIFIFGDKTWVDVHIWAILAAKKGKHVFKVRWE